MFVGHTPTVDGFDALNPAIYLPKICENTFIFKVGMQYVKNAGHVYELICANYVRLHLAQLGKCPSVDTVEEKASGAFQLQLDNFINVTTLTGLND